MFVRFFILLTVLLSCLLDVAWGGTVIWDDGETNIPGLHGDGISWNDRLNWNTDTVPLDIDDVVLTTDTVRVQDGNIAFAKTLNSGSTILEINGSLNVSGEFTNNSTVMIVSPSDSSNTGAGLRIGEGSSFEGTGEVLLRRSEGVGVVPASLGSIGTLPFTNGAQHTIRGEGLLTSNFINEGLVIAEDLDGNSGSRLRITDNIENNNIIRTTASATISASVSFTQGPSGRLIADANTFLLNSSVITGGTLETLNGGVFSSSGNFLGLDGVHLLGELNLVATGSLTGSARVLGSGVVNDGTIVLNETNVGSAFLAFFDSTTISGTGEIIMNREDFGARLQTDVGIVGTIGPGQTVRGVGRIEGNFINDGLIVAEPRNAGTSLQFVTGTLTNNSIVRSDAGALMRLRAQTVTQNNATGQILANEGTVELYNNTTIEGGTLNAVGAGKFTVQIGARLTNVVNNAPFEVPSGNNPLRLNGTSFENNNTVTVGNVLLVESDLELTGTGDINLTTAGNSRLEVSAGRTATLDSGQTIRGAGQINGPGTFVNEGRIEGPSTSILTEINGTLSGEGVLKNVRIDGTHSPGDGVGSTPVEGAYRIGNFGGTLAIEIGGTTPGTEYDQLVSTDPTSVVTIGTSSTNLNVTFADLANAYIPTAGDRFTIIDSPNNIVGNFQFVHLPSTGFGRAIQWLPLDLSDPQKMVLEIAAVNFLGADFDEDYDVDQDDLTIWKNAYGVSTLGDADADGDTDGKDFLIWQKQFGLAAPATPTLAAVPEPSGVLLLACGLAGLLGRGNRSRSIALD